VCIDGEIYHLYFFSGRKRRPEDMIYYHVLWIEVGAALPISVFFIILALAAFDS
jgi:hypothetical protein